MLRRLTLAALLCATVDAAEFAKDIAPVFEARCQLCHGAKQQMAGLRLDQALKAGAHEKIIARITSTDPKQRMPPVGEPLKPAQIAAVKEWIGSGATWPANYKPGAAQSALWSLAPVSRKAPPVVAATNWPRNPIDHYVLATLESRKIKPSAEADRLTLLRRVTIDLTGLPPTPAEVAAFLSDTKPDAYERAVDRLLASPHYGERWARPWLDLAHYADSDGYEKDNVRPYAWRYRNWVIDALNRDLPFDQFTVEQIAGDLLPKPTEDQLAATGFFRNTLTNREAGVDRAEARYDQLINRVNTLGTTWLGLTVGCAQCHDHKYDPITNKDFYQLFAFFDAAEEVEVEAPLAGERERYVAALPAYLAMRGHILEKYNIAAKQKVWEDKIRFAISDPGKDLEWDFSITSMRAMFDRAEKILKTEPSKRSPRDQRRLTDYFLANPGPDNNRDAAEKEIIREAQRQIAEAGATLPSFTMAMAFADDHDFRQSHTRIKGDYRAMGNPISAGTLAVLPPLKNAANPTRLDLARWLVSKDNPLTARVTVNRAWQELFGRGLVLTSEDFGTQGENPTHPELLDFLAARFMDDGWSMKKLHRLIVTSATYRQSSAARPDVQDPGNTLLARQSRLRMPAELIRDAALAASGLLDARVGGPSIQPFQPAGVAELGYGGRKWRQSEGSERFRRGLYVHFQRTTPYPQLMNFDAPDSNVACSRRRASNTSLQSLNLLNDPVFFEAAQALSGRVLKESSDFAARLDAAYLLALGRKPDPQERERLARYYDQQLGILQKEEWTAAKLAPPSASNAKEAAAWTGIARVILNLDEFITRE